MKALLLAALLLPGLGFAATLTGSMTDSSASVDLAATGTLDWARWPGYSSKARIISNVTTSGRLSTYSNDPRVIGDRRGIQVSGRNSYFEIKVPVTTSERTLIYYIGGWNATGRLTATLPGATALSATVSGNGTFSRVVTVRFMGEAPGTLTVRYTLVSGSGMIRMQAAALQGNAAPPPPPPPPPPPSTGSATLTWDAPTHNEDGTVLSDLTAFKIYWGTTQGTYNNTLVVNNPNARTWTLQDLAAGQWHFVVTSLAATGEESSFSLVVNKTIQ